MAPEQPPILEITQLSASYGPVQIVNGVSFALSKGESVTILGANGAGKTSLLRAICGLLVRRQGSVKLDGVEIAQKPPHEIVRMGISQVPEGRHLFPSLTVLENLKTGALPLANSGRANEIASGIHLVFELFPRLAERRGQLAGTLSGGEQQMLAIGRALVSQPRIILLDEPSVGLAPRVIENLFAVLHQLKATGLTLVLAEQNVRLALELSDRALVMRLGRIVLSGTPHELRDNPELQKVYLG